MLRSKTLVAGYHHSLRGCFPKAIGGDVPGDVQITPHGEAITSPNPLISEPLETLDFRELTNHVDSFGLPGVQAKASASMINMPISDTNEQAILKIDPPEHPNLVLNEHLHLDHARQLKIPVAQHKVAWFVGN
ncbi:hypothetical protein WG939_00300 [Corynebacterium sp. H130]|uniref:hypothetical protein n=1 Tax=Corynebacterium sp. H130 TaxID=3133444 RepID=UPI0030AA793E